MLKCYSQYEREREPNATPGKNGNWHEARGRRRSPLRGLFFYLHSELFPKGLGAELKQDDDLWQNLKIHWSSSSLDLSLLSGGLILCRSWSFITKVAKKINPWSDLRSKKNCLNWSRPEITDFVIASTLVEGASHRSPRPVVWGQWVRRSSLTIKYAAFVCGLQAGLYINEIRWKPSNGPASEETGYN